MLCVLVTLNFWESAIIAEKNKVYWVLRKASRPQFFILMCEIILANNLVSLLEPFTLKKDVPMHFYY